MAQLFAERLFDLPTLPAGWQLIAIGIGPRFEVLLLTRVGSDGPPSRYRVYENRDRSLRAVDLHAPSAVAYQFIQPVGEGNLFLASAWKSPGAVGAGHVWTRSGKLLREVDIGEGIEDVQATSTSEIWVSQFDEGVFRRGGSGLACFTEDGRRVFAFSDVVRETNVPAIDDCYALNVVSDDDVWLYYYSAFPLVRLVGKKLAGIWSTGRISGARTFAVGERSVLFVGGYENPRAITRLFPESSRTETMHVSAEGSPLEFTRACGRGDRLFLAAPSALWSVLAD